MLSKVNTLSLEDSFCFNKRKCFSVNLWARCGVQKYQIVCRFTLWFVPRAALRTSTSSRQAGLLREDVCLCTLTDESLHIYLPSRPSIHNKMYFPNQTNKAPIHYGLGNHKYKNFPLSCHLLGKNMNKKSVGHTQYTQKSPFGRRSGKDLLTTVSGPAENSMT